MALSRRAKLVIGGAVLAGAAALTTTGMAFAAPGEPSLRITETVDDSSVTGTADDGNCSEDGRTGGTENAGAVSER